MQKTVGIQAVGLGGSFHEIAARDYFYMDEEDIKLAPYLHHSELVEAFHRQHVDEMVIAVDNTVSGRVLTAVDALSGMPSNVHVVGSRVVPIEQKLLLAPGILEDDITALMSQRPAVEQCYGYIRNKGLVVIESSDTLQAAKRVKETGGMIGGYVVGAIASSSAGVNNGLTVGRTLNDRQDNATKFWRVSREKKWDESGSHVAITFDLPSASGALLRAIQIISSEHGYDISDVDSHLHPHTDKKRSFFVELIRNSSKNPATLVYALRSSNIRSRLLGIYDSEELVVLEDDSEQIPVALMHDEWEARRGLLMEDNARVLHVEACNQPKALLAILKCLKGVNILDMSRPTVPRGDNFSRGFYFVLDGKTRDTNIDEVIKKLEQASFGASQFTYKNGKLTS